MRLLFYTEKDADCSWVLHTAPLQKHRNIPLTGWIKSLNLLNMFPYRLCINQQMIAGMYVFFVAHLSQKWHDKPPSFWKIHAVLRGHWLMLADISSSSLQRFAPPLLLVITSNQLMSRWKEKEPTVSEVMEISYERVKLHWKHLYALSEECVKCTDSLYLM